MVRVVLVDDHPVFRHGLRALLSATPEVEVLAEGADGDEAIRLALELRPDVVVMDLNLPTLNGVDATRRILASAPELAILVLTMFEDDDSVFAAMRAGARGYLVKGADGPEILRAITAVADGEAIFGQSVAGRILRYLTKPLDARDERMFPELTTREREVLSHLASGLTNGQIATRLSLSPKTVRNNVSGIFTKLQVADRAEAIVRARRAGLGLEGNETR
ncbi:MAG TPA: response regulator transcription factor [Kribbella sp.]